MNLIYQYWTGNMPFYASIASKAMENYANQIGAEYRLDINPKFFIANSHAQYHNAFRCIYDTEFDKYDNILFCDLDIFPTDHCNTNIFDQNVPFIGICEETHQPAIRYAKGNEKAPIGKNSEERWAELMRKKYNINVPRDSKNRVRVFNSGVVLYSRKGIEAAKKGFQPIEEYVATVSGLPKFYGIDQNYLHAMLVYMLGDQMTVMDNVLWNAQIHYIKDPKTKALSILDNRELGKTNFVHLQLRGRDSLTVEKIEDIVNKPINEWRHKH